MDIILQHVRCFSQSREVPLRPLTLLVGENSTGKSTFLSIVSSVLDVTRFPSNPGFNEPPYSLGNFDTVATYRGGKYGRDETFSIGFRVGPDEGEGPKEVVATYGGDYGNVVLRQLKATTKNGKFAIKVTGSKLYVHAELRERESGPPRIFEAERVLDEAMQVGSGSLPLDLLLQTFLLEVSKHKREELQRGDLEQLFSLVRATRPPYANCYSFAPIRSKPKRTYDEVSESYSPEGDHIPTLLARLLRQAPQSADSQRVQRAIKQFGTESGLFRSIGVKMLGKKASDPFQIQVSVAGPPVNLADVGYGVSQALPLVVQSVLKTTSRVLLMQQPEVHLHPRAQAALGSFFADLATEGDRLIVMETHSDNLIDRVRQEVAAGKIAPDRVLILFFHKPELETTIYPITLDEMGNVENAPPEYRQFFLEEEFRLLSRTER